jgi:hypothetical protein
MFIRFRINFFCLPAVAVFICSVYVSCANTTPELISSNATVVFDYHDGSSAPLMRLSVFTETGSDARRASQIKIASRNSGYEWTVEDPQLIGSDKRQWAGYTNFAVPGLRKLPQGQYDLFYTDAEDRTVQTVFSVSYPDHLVDSVASEAGTILGPSAKEMIAVYMADGTLIYYNTRKPEWKNDDDMWNEMKSASSIRKCLAAADGTCVCFMPSEERPSSAGRQ